MDCFADRVSRNPQLFAGLVFSCRCPQKRKHSGGETKKRVFRPVFRVFPAEVIYGQQSSSGEHIAQAEPRGGDASRRAHSDQRVESPSRKAFGDRIEIHFRNGAGIFLHQAVVVVVQFACIGTKENAVSGDACFYWQTVKPVYAIPDRQRIGLGRKLGDRLVHPFRGIGI